jgi:hypothetical protein
VASACVNGNFKRGVRAGVRGDGEGPYDEISLFFANGPRGPPGHLAVRGAFLIHCIMRSASCDHASKHCCRARAISGFPTITGSGLGDLTRTHEPPTRRPVVLFVFVCGHRHSPPMGSIAWPTATPPPQRTARPEGRRLEREKSVPTQSCAFAY